jgi:hypothetical protein
MRILGKGALMPNHPDNIPTRITDPYMLKEAGDDEEDYYYSKEFEHLIKNAPSFPSRIVPPNLTDRITEISKSNNCTHVSLIFETEDARVFKILKKQDAADWLKAMDACVSFCLAHGHNPFDEFFRMRNFEERITRKIK